MMTRHRDHLFHALQSRRLAGIKGLHLAAKRWAHQHARVEHARANHIDAKAGTTIRLDRPVEPLQRLADQGEGRIRLQADIGRNRPLRRGLHQFAEAGFSTRCMTDLAACHGDFTGRHAPQVSRRANQHRPHARARLAHRHPEVFHARRAAGHHHAELTHDPGGHPAGEVLDGPLIIGMKGQSVDCGGNVVVDRIDTGVSSAHLSPVGIKLIGQQHGQTGMNALPHLRLRHEHRDRAVSAQADPAVEGHLPRCHGRQNRRHQSLAYWHQPPADRQPAHRCNRSQDEIPACRHGPLALLEVGKALDGATAAIPRP